MSERNNSLMKMEVIVRPGKLDAVKKALATAGYTGLTISQAEGHGTQKGKTQEGSELGYRMEFVPKVRMEIVVASEAVERLVQAVSAAAATGKPGDGKIFLYCVEDAIRIRTGERGLQAV
jgi:nitrogen regulatory protein PII